MADTHLGQRARAANISRRVVLGGLTCSPRVQSLAVKCTPSGSAWSEALSAYVGACRTCDAYYANVLGPAYRRAEAELERLHLPQSGERGRAVRRRLMREHRIFILEDEANDFAAVRHSCLCTLVRTPADELEGLKIKILLLYETHLQHIDEERLFEAMAADAARLLS